MTCVHPIHPSTDLFVVSWFCLLQVKVKVAQSCPTRQSMEFSRPEYWSGQPFPSPGIKSRYPALQVDSLPAKPLGKTKNTGVGSLSLLQWIFPTQESNHGLHHRRILYQLSYEGSHLYTQSQVVIYGHAFSTIDESSFSQQLTMLKILNFS